MNMNAADNYLIQKYGSKTLSGLRPQGNLELLHPLFLYKSQYVVEEQERQYDDGNLPTKGQRQRQRRTVKSNSGRELVILLIVTTYMLSVTNSSKYVNTLMLVLKRLRGKKV